MSRLVLMGKLSRDNDENVGIIQNNNRYADTLAEEIGNFNRNIQR